jgi:hypothetical protein
MRTVRFESDAVRDHVAAHGGVLTVRIGPLMVG